MNKKIIGLCVTSLNTEYGLDFIEIMYEAASKAGCKLMVFNATNPIETPEEVRLGAKSLFSLINFDIIDILVLGREKFSSSEVMDRIALEAKAHNCPVVVIGHENKNAISVNNWGGEAFEDIVRHVIEFHGAKNPYFIGGLEGEQVSEERLSAFKRVLLDNGIPCDDSRIFYGGFTERAVKPIVDDILENDEAPDAIICANDSMAIEAINLLKERGISVPEDIIVTGYDGIPLSRFHEPSLTTGAEDLEGAAALVIDILNKASANEKIEDVYEIKHKICLRESCGCRESGDGLMKRRTGAFLYQEIYETRRQENALFRWASAVLMNEGSVLKASTFADYMLPNSYICLKKGALRDITRHPSDPYENCYGDTLETLVAVDEDLTRVSMDDFDAELMIPDIEGFLKDDSLVILNSLYVDDIPLGYYAARTTDCRRTCHNLNRTAMYINLAFVSQYERTRQSKLVNRIENTKYYNSVSKLYNYKGLQKWFDKFSDNEENHELWLSASVYNIKRFKYILENYGLDVVEGMITYVAKAFKASVRPECSVIAQITEDDFVIFNYLGNCERADMDALIKETTDSFYAIIGDYNEVSGNPFTLEINAGCVICESGWTHKLDDLIKLANGELYLNRLKYGSEAVSNGYVSDEDKTIIDEEKKKDLEDKFDLLMEKNLFTYFFQPLVEVKTGEIYAYEALMRTPKEIGLFPLEILELAEQKNKLYGIEYATFFNVMERYQRDIESFYGRKVFVNTIPGHFLSQADLKTFTSKYRKYMEYCVIELTEGETLADKELQIMKTISSPENGIMIAVDDYGTGHSNIVNVLRYEPQIIKIDRYLITDIHKDNNKRMFVANAIEFARANNIKVVAEGVETKDELDTVIALGADLIQGYYTAKPSPVPLKEIPEEIKQEMIAAYQKRVAGFGNSYI